MHHLFLAMKIHISENTKEILDKLGGYIVEKRGTVEVKVIRTIWNKVILNLPFDDEMYSPYSVLSSRVNVKHIWIYANFC
jgi:hypothetical protein